MKSYKILSLALLAGASVAFTACDDDKELTLNAPDAKLLKEIKFEVSDILPLGVGMDSLLVWTSGPDDVDDPTVVFTSSNPDVATVDQTGKITALSVGEAQIVARAGFDFKVYDAEASVTVQVIPEVIKATSIEIRNTTPLGEDGVIYETDELQLEATILPENHTYSNISWHSADEKIATVDQNGLVKCVGAGTAKIYVLAHDHGTARGEFSFEIKPYIPAQKITIEALDAPVCLTRGEFKLDFALTPANATLGSVEWSVSDPSIVSVHRGIVTPKSFGTATVTAKCVSTGEQTSVDVTVDPGWYIWDAENQWNGWGCGDSNAPDVKGDKVWHVDFANPTAKTGRNIKILNASNNNPVTMCKEYPVLAVRILRPNGGVSKLDAATAAGENYSRIKELNPGNGEALADGTRLLIYDVVNDYNPKPDQIKFRVFQFKITDFTGLTAANAFYEIYWIRTFKSADEAREFANAEVAAGN